MVSYLALGLVAGLAAVVDLRGTDDALGRELQVTEVAVADEVAAAAELVMGKSAGVPVAVADGLGLPVGVGSEADAGRPEPTSTSFVTVP